MKITLGKYTKEMQKNIEKIFLSQQHYRMRTRHIDLSCKIKTII